MSKKYITRCSRCLLTLICLFCGIFASAEEVRYLPPELKNQLETALAKRGKDYVPRTRNLLGNGQPAYVNRLILEDSPYLLQHAHNPVNWNTWGEEAFARAKKENKPVFLSIGYSTCHWCHVMEEESFDDPEVASILNEHFISIKVDRESRPDVDAVYMAAVQLMTGGGGWPMSSFLTPDGKTFVGGSYFKPEPFKQLLVRVSNLWKTQQAQLIARAEQVAAAVAENHKHSREAKSIGQDEIQKAIKEILRRHDRSRGGFGSAPKFPNEPWLFFLMEAAWRNGNRTALEAVESSLQAMARGGIYDQVGGGFHRYATDDRWLVPHFEKMLYNQALLARIYLYAYRLTGRSTYARIARETLDYVLRDMTSPDGGFYSASDADSEEGEGVYYLWTMEEIRQSLPKNLYGLAIDLYGISEKGNFEGRNILHLTESREVFADKKGISRLELDQKIESVRTKLQKTRRQRPSPLRDDKILTAWNAMMIHTLAEAAEILQEPEYLSAAERAAELIWQKNRMKSGRLRRTYLNGRASMDALLDDYAFLAEAFLQLYDATSKPVWLDRAKEITRVMLNDFHDEKEGGFFMNAGKTGGLLMVRPKEVQDGPVPSANAVALRVLSKLSKRVPDLEYNRQADAVLGAFSSSISRSPASYASMLIAADELNNGEIGHHQYAARGMVSVRAAAKKENGGNTLILDITIQPGWHINSHEPLQDYLIPTEVVLAGDTKKWKLARIHYPAPQQKKLRFQKEILSLYEGSIRIKSLLDRIEENSLPPQVQLTLQACSDQVCLPPDKLRLRLPVLLDRSSESH